MIQIIYEIILKTIYLQEEKTKLQWSLLGVFLYALLLMIISSKIYVGSSLK